MLLIYACSFTTVYSVKKKTVKKKLKIKNETIENKLE